MKHIANFSCLWPSSSHYSNQNLGGIFASANTDTDLHTLQAWRSGTSCSNSSSDVDRELTR
jgi:hypothetical protein